MFAEMALTDGNPTPTLPVIARSASDEAIHKRLTRLWIAARLRRSQ